MTVSTKELMRGMQNLANNYFAIGLDTPEKIAEKYCPNNSGYASYLRKMMSYGG